MASGAVSAAKTMISLVPRFKVFVACKRAWSQYINRRNSMETDSKGPVPRSLLSKGKWSVIVIPKCRLRDHDIP